MASQMIIIIVLGAFLGKWLDGYFQTDQAYFTAICSLLAIALALYSSLKDFIFRK